VKCENKVVSNQVHCIGHLKADWVEHAEG
jgi:hypothetical protein